MAAIRKASSSVSRNLKIIIILSIIGIIISGYLFYTKYSDVKSFCDFSPELSCDAVNQSPYSEFPANSGIPISGLGIIAFLIFIIPSALLLNGFDFRRIIPGMRARHVHYLLLLLVILSLLFYVYLTSLELYVIYAICPLCVVEFVITIIMSLFILHNTLIVRRKA